MYTIDTHATIQQLQAKGFSAEQAEGIASVVSRSDADLATKADLEAAINAALLKSVLSQVAVAGLLFAAIKLFA